MNTLVHFGLTTYNANAINAYKKVLELNDEASDAWYELGYSYNKMGNIDEACYAWKKSAALGYESAKTSLNTYCK